MRKHGCRALVLGLLAALAVASAGPTYAAVDLGWLPTPQTADVGEQIVFGLYGASTTDANEEISALDAIITWDTAFLDFVGLGDPLPIWMFDGFFDVGELALINGDLGDGEVLYSGLANFGQPVVITPAGTLLAEFKFTALAPTPGTDIQFRSAVVKNDIVFKTQVFSAANPNLDIKASLCSGTVEIVPEPMSLTILTAGVAGFLGLRKRHA